MCGIVGIVNRNENFIKNSIKLLNHRGPNDNGSFISSKISLGQVRLSIIDLSKDGQQPIFYDNKNLIITFNGEIYNYLEIKRELETKGYKFETKTDTEVILASYHFWGVDCVKKFRGMWAFAIYNKKEDIVFLSRDRFGKKPLYIYNYNNIFSFSSELKCFMSDSSFNLTISEKDLNHYLAFKYVRPNKSIFNEVFKLKAGHNLIYNLTTKKISIKKYFELNLNKKYSKKDFNKIFPIEFKKAIKERSIADVPIGTFLSGGVDSSAVVAYMKKIKKNIKTFSIGFNLNKFDESSFAKEVSDKFETEHYNIKFNSNDILSTIEDLSFYFDEPFGDSSLIPTYLVSKLASSKVTVVLGGDGADEVFGGYERYWIYRILSFQKYIPYFLRVSIYNIIKNIGLKFNLINLTKISKFIITNKKVELHIVYGKLFSSISDNDFYNLRNEKINFDSFKSSFKYNFGKNIQLCDLNSYLLEDILVKVDRASMANSIEVRTPFLSENIVELGLNLKNSSKFGFYSGKKLLKKYLEKDLSDKILYRKKKGFSIPISNYFKNELKYLVIEKVINYDKHNYFNKKHIKEICLNHFRGKKDNSAIIWNILMFNLWYERWIKK